jgi:nucleoside-diphosphate-sugar epimerase
VHRVLVTGGAGPLGSAIARRILRDPDWELRASDHRPLPQWLRESGEVHVGDLGAPGAAEDALAGCSHAIHVSAHDDAPGPYSLLAAATARDRALIDAALSFGIDRLVYLSVAGPDGAAAFAALTGEVWSVAARTEHGLPVTVCRAWDPLPHSGVVAGALEGRSPLTIPDRMLWPLGADELADGVVRAMALPAAEGETVDLAGAPVPAGEVARLAWAAAGRDPAALVLAEVSEPAEEPARAAARALLGWEPSRPLRQELARLAANPATVIRP